MRNRCVGGSRDCASNKTREKEKIPTALNRCGFVHLDEAPPRKVNTGRGQRQKQRETDRQAHVQMCAQSTEREGVCPSVCVFVCLICTERGY